MSKIKNYLRFSETRVNKNVRKGGLEPPHLSILDPKSSAAANYATFAVKL